MQCTACAAVYGSLLGNFSLGGNKYLEALEEMRLLLLGRLPEELVFVMTMVQEKEVEALQAEEAASAKAWGRNRSPGYSRPAPIPPKHGLGWSLGLGPPLWESREWGRSPGLGLRLGTEAGLLSRWPNLGALLQSLQSSASRSLQPSALPQISPSPAVCVVQSSFNKYLPNSAPCQALF